MTPGESRFDYKQRALEIAGRVGWTDENIMDRVFDFFTADASTMSMGDDVIEHLEIYARRELKDRTQAAGVNCQNCDWTGSETDLREAKDLFLRVAPGEPMPAGDCPSCGALCHADKVVDGPEF